MLVCPGGYFADNQTHSCVDVCPGPSPVDTFGFEGDRTCKDLCDDGWFAQNSSRLCMSYCPLD